VFQQLLYFKTPAPEDSNNLSTWKSIWQIVYGILLFKKNLNFNRSFEKGYNQFLKNDKLCTQSILNPGFEFTIAYLHFIMLNC
jgi:hypothetical protein